MRNRMKRGVVVLLVMVLVFGVSQSSVVTAETTGKLPNKLYKMVKGKWYTQASSAGYDVKFTKNHVNYYYRKDSKCAYSGKIKKVKKIKSGEYKDCYRIIFQNANGVSSFVSIDKKASGFNYYDGVSGHKGYSGSSSISRGRWK